MDDAKIPALKMEGRGMSQEMQGMKLQTFEKSKNWALPSEALQEPALLTP